MLIVLLAAASHGFGSSEGFQVGIELSTQVPVTHAVEEALRDIGIGFVNYYPVSYPGAPDLPAREVNDAMMALCERLGIDFAHSCHQIDPPDQVVVDSVARAAAAGRGMRYRGVIFDEIEHIRLLNNASPVPLVDSSAFQTLDHAHDATIEGYRRLKSRFDSLGAPVIATHMWPVAHSLAARAGFTVCAKVCKELYSPVSMAIAMGAAKQYGTDLWIDCDLWMWDLIPGHPPEEFRSNLLMAYWLGADLVYVEGCGYNLRPAGNQGIPFSLMTQITPDTYQLTPHGEVLRWFCREYVPANPRKWTFRDVRPDIVIVRFEDTCHGQRYTSDWPDRLYGSEYLRSDRETEAWFGLWNLLTLGATNRDGLSFFKAWVRPSGYQRAVKNDMAASCLTRPAQSDIHRFFVPLNGVVVYDHLVGYDLLKDVPLIFVTGKRVSGETIAAVRRCAREGAVCVLWGPLVVGHGFADWSSGVKVIEEGSGRIVLTDDFGFREVYQQIDNLIGRPDRICYRFGDSEVVLRRVTDNEVRVEVGSGR